MDIRIKTKAFLHFGLLLFILILPSCKTKVNYKQKSSGDQFMIHEFKKTVFIECLNRGFNKSQAFQDVLAEDRSCSQDFALGSLNYRYIDTLAMNLALKIKQDSIIINRGHYDNLEEYGEMIGKRVFMICLDYYTSPELDSITRDRFFK